MAIVKQVIGSLGDLGVEVVKETVKMPKTVVTGVPGSQETVNTPSASSALKESSAVENNQQQRRVPARRVLEEFVGVGRPDKQPTVWEQKQSEEEKKKKEVQELAKEKEKHTLPTISTKQKRGNLYGMKAKQGSEISKNVKAE